MANEYTDKIFQTIDEIVTARIASLPYDQTIICTIKNISRQKIGEYLVHYQNTDFVAYSENKNYKVGEEVYVSIPQSDYTSKKMITGKVISHLEDKKIIKPFSEYIQITDNFNSNPLQETKIQANGAMKEIYVFDKSFLQDENSLIANCGYDSLGFKFSIAADLGDTITEGTYGVKILIRGYNLKNISQTTTNFLTDLLEETISVDDIININAYNTFGYHTQERVYSIADYLITGIKVLLFQNSDFNFSDAQEKYISVNNVNISFGYKGNSESFGNEKLYIYSTQGYIYDDNSMTKNIYGRFIKKDLNGKYIIDNNHQVLTWGYQDLYGKGSSVLGPQYTDIQDTSGISCTLQIAQLDNGIKTKDKIKIQCQAEHNISMKKILSNTFEFENGKYTANLDIIDAIIGFRVDAIGDTKGVFNIYGQDGALLNDAEAYKRQHLGLSYRAEASSRKLSAGDKISWIIPINNTMILPSQAGKYNYEITLTDENLDDSGYFLLPFYIKKIYSPELTNNTIACTLQLKDGDNKYSIYTNNKELLFGTSGSSGSDFIFSLELYDSNRANKISALPLSAWDNTTQKGAGIVLTPQGTLTISTGATYSIEPHLYDYNLVDKIDSVKNNIVYEWEEEGRIVKAKINNQNNSYNLISFLVLSFGEPSHYISGCKTITYDITGKKPNYYKQQYELYSSSGLVRGITWSLLNTNPVLSLQDNRIIPPTLYAEDYAPHTVIGKSGNTLRWVQPILIIQNKYPTAMQNAESNYFKIDDTTSVTSVMAGKMLTQKTGLFLGNIKEGQQPERFGLFGYYSGDKFLSITPDDSYLIKATHIKTTDSIGTINNPVYVKSDGQIEACTNVLAYNLSVPNAIGSATQPVYFNNNGRPVACTKYEDAIVAQSRTAQYYDTTLENTEGSIAYMLKQLQEQIDHLK